VYPYVFEPVLKGLNPEEVFVVMPFDGKYDDVFSELICPAVHLSATDAGQTLKAYRTKGDPRTTSGWIEVLEHLYTAQIVLGVLTEETNANVHYELGIAHATQPITRQVLMAEQDYTPRFDTKDLIFIRYDATSPGRSVRELATRLETALTEWSVEQEKVVRHAIAKLSPFDFEFVRLWGQSRNFAFKTTESGPTDYENQVGRVHGQDWRFMKGVFKRHCAVIARLQQNGMLALSTHRSGEQVEFSYWWTDLGNMVLVHFGLISPDDRRVRHKDMPRDLRRISS
jgi:hypothetical protein